MAATKSVADRKSNKQKSSNDNITKATRTTVPLVHQKATVDLLPAERKHFPQRLMEILDDEDKHSDVIKWLPNGRGFIILKREKFVKEVLPKYFQNCKFESFTRNLNRWGFYRVSREAATAGAYHHKLFRRDEPWMCNQMIVSKVPQTFHRTIFDINSQKTNPVPILPSATAAAPVPTAAGAQTTPQSMVVVQYPAAQQQVQGVQQAPPTTVAAAPAPANSNLLQFSQVQGNGLITVSPQVFIQPQQFTLQQQQQQLMTAAGLQTQAQQLQHAANVIKMQNASALPFQQQQFQALLGSLGPTASAVLQQQPQQQQAVVVPQLQVLSQQQQTPQPPQQHLALQQPSVLLARQQPAVVNAADASNVVPSAVVKAKESQVETKKTEEKVVASEVEKPTASSKYDGLRWEPAPLHPNEDARMEVLEGTGMLDSEPENRYDNITITASQQFSMPIVLVSLVDKERQWFKSVQGIDAKETPRDQAFCAHAILQDQVFYVPDTLKDDRFAENPLVVDENGPKIRFYAGVPLRVGNVNVGTLCLIDSKPRDLSPEQKSVLQGLGKMVEKELEKTLNKSDLSHSTVEKLAISVPVEAA